MKKRNIYLILTLLIVMSMLFTACGPAEAPEEPEEGEEPSEGEEPEEGEEPAEGDEYAERIVVGKLTDAAYLDPNQSVGIGEIIVTSQIYEGLVAPNPDTREIEPQLAEDWEISDDALVYTFNLKPDLKFSDGSPVTGEDWEWSLYRARDAETSGYRFAAAPIDTVEATDEQVVITLKEPSASFLGNLCMFNLTVGSKSHWDAVGEEQYAMEPLGTGPFMLKEWAREEYITLERNPNYWEEGMPLTDVLQFKVVTDDNTRALQLQAGEIDVMMDVPFSMISQIEEDDSVEVHTFPSTQIRYMLLNTQKEPLDNNDVRRAIQMAIDKEELAEIVTLGYGKPAHSILSETQGDWFYSDLEIDEYDPEAAKELLAEAGYPDGIELDISVLSGSAVYEQLAILLQSQLADAGIDVTVNLLERAALLDEFRSLSHEATILQWVDDYPDPSGIMNWTLQYDQSDAWYTGLDDEELEAFNEQANLELDLEKRVGMYHTIQQRIYDNANVLPLFSNSFVWASDENVEGLYISPFYVFHTKELRMKK